MTLRVAVIGVGYMGFNHLRVLSERRDCQVVGAVDPSAARRAKARDTFKVPTFSTLSDLLRREPELDAATVAASTDRHYDVARPLLENGVHLLVEKPFTGSIQHGKTLVDLARRKRLCLSAGYVERFNPVLSKMWELGRKKRVRWAMAERLNPVGPGESLGSVVMDLAVHDIDFLLRLFGEPRSVQARGLVKRGFIYHLSATLEFPRGVLGRLEAGVLYPLKRRVMRLAGDGLLIEGDTRAQELFLYKSRTIREALGFSETLFSGVDYEIARPMFRKEEPLKLELQEFLKAVKGGGPPPVPGEDAIQILRIAERIVDCCLEGSPSGKG